MAGQDFEQLGGGFAGSVVKGEGDGGPGIGSPANRRGKPGTRRDAHGVSQRSGGDHRCADRCAGRGFEDALEIGHGQQWEAAQKVRVAG